MPLTGQKSELAKILAAAKKSEKTILIIVDDGKGGTEAIGPADKPGDGPAKNAFLDYYGNPAEFYAMYKAGTLFKDSFLGKLIAKHYLVKYTTRNSVLYKEVLKRTNWQWPVDYLPAWFIFSYTGNFYFEVFGNSYETHTLPEARRRINECAEQDVFLKFSDSVLKTNDYAAIKWVLAQKMGYFTPQYGISEYYKFFDGLQENQKTDTNYLNILLPLNGGFINRADSFYITKLERLKTVLSPNYFQLIVLHLLSKNFWTFFDNKPDPNRKNALNKAVSLQKLLCGYNSYITEVSPLVQRINDAAVNKLPLPKDTFRAALNKFEKEGEDFLNLKIDSFLAIYMKEMELSKFDACDQLKSIIYLKSHEIEITLSNLFKLNEMFEFVSYTREELKLKRKFISRIGEARRDYQEYLAIIK